MGKTHIFAMVFFIFSYLLKTFTNGDEWILFKENESLDGKLCELTDIAFRKQSVPDKSVCLFNCVTHSGCESVFHAEYTGHCIGCSVSYGLSNLPTRDAMGFKYYAQTSK